VAQSASKLVSQRPGRTQTRNSRHAMALIRFRVVAQPVCGEARPVSNRPNMPQHVKQTQHATTCQTDTTCHNMSNKHNMPQHVKQTQHATTCQTDTTCHNMSNRQSMPLLCQQHQILHVSLKTPCQPIYLSIYLSICHQPAHQVHHSPTLLSVLPRAHSKAGWYGCSVVTRCFSGRWQ